MYADRVKDTTLSTGTGAITLAGVAPTGYQTFAAGFGASAVTVSYCIADQAGNNWEVGVGTFNGTTGLTRTTVLGSSNAGAPVAFTAGTKDVFCTAPAKYLDTFTSANQGAVPASGGGTANFLRADGTFAAPLATAPAGSTTQIQYNNAGAFGASANFTYTVGTTTLTVPTINSTNIITNAGTGANGSDFVLSVGNASGTGYRGGNLTVNAGSGINGAGGVMTFNAGNSLGGNASGGGISFIGGAGSGSAVAGGISMRGGNASTGIGGSFALYGGNSSSGTGGDCQFFPGAGPVANGSLVLSDGNIYIIQIQDIGGASCMGFFEAAPVPQPTTATTAATRVAVIGTVANIGDTYDGYTLAKVVKALRNLGILA
jgi:hypothetical protein